MKKLLLTTALSFVIAAPAMAVDEERVNSHAQKAAEEAVEELTQEQKDMMAAEAEATASAPAVVAAEGEAVVSEEKTVVIKESAEGVVETETTTVVVTKDMPAEPPAAVQEAPMADASAAEPASGAMPEAHGDWGYTGAVAAPYWGTLNAAYETCSSGESQSPINISKFLQEDLPDIEPGFKPSPLVVKNNGHTIEVDFQSGSGFSVDGHQHALQHAHFHTPSEHYLDGAPYPMELHLLHTSPAGGLAMIAVMVKLGEHNPVVEGIWQNTPITAGGEKVIDTVEISAADLLPPSLDYYKYEGSLTVPPCTEGVQWFVLKEPIELSETQLKAFQALFPVNARPVQALNERVVTGD